jgi:DNA gyrase inhibitor GyrI
MATEEPVYEVTLRDGAFEVRSYAPTVIAEVTVTGNQRTAASKGFRLLAGYIFGGNQRREGIAMTAPVSVLPTNEKIAMTAPVSQSRRNEQQPEEWVVRFTMPRGLGIEQLPIPNDPQVKTKAVPQSRYAVLRFSGRATQEDFDSRSAELKAWLPAHQLQPIGPPSLAQYNPPWTLWFMRRNEVLIAVSP